LADSSARWIGVGLVIFIAAGWVPAMPVVTAMAILALGATNATIARFARSPALIPVVLLHAATYATLYALFIGATLHAATGSTTGRLSAWSALDLVASTLPMAVALKRIGQSFLKQVESRS
jgi:hypothetical protein